MMTPLNESQLARWLCDLIAIPSVTGEEDRALEFVREAFQPLAPDVFRAPFPAGLDRHEEYLRDRAVDGRPNRANVIARWPGTIPGRLLLLQSHVDVVPWEGWDDALDPRFAEGRVTGRGACDAKGQVAVLYQAARLLGGRDFQPAMEVEIQIVSEEEVGGNGALAAIVDRPAADGVIVLEPTGLRGFCANRGSQWYRFEVEGRSVHMGRKWEGVNAIEMACELIRDLGHYEQGLLEASRNVPLFEEYEIPVQVNVGQIEGGDWPASVAGFCAFEGGVGFLPNLNRARIREDLQRLIAESANPWIREHARVTFNRLKNEAYASNPGHPMVRTFHETLGRMGLDARPAGWNVSCDARLYATVAGIPAIVFGAGGIAQAHTRGEYVEMAQVLRAAEVLAAFVRAYAGPDR